MKKVVVKLQSIMEKNGITSLVQLSEVTGIRRAALSAIANGKRDRIQLEHIERIAAALNIDDMNEIIGFE